MYLKSFLEVYKDQKYIMNDNIKFYCSTFKLILTNLKTQQMLDNHIRCCWFLTELLKKMQFKLMKKHDIDSQNSAIMIFNRLYKDELKKAQKMKQEHDLNKKMSENMLKKLNQQKKKFLKNDFINVRADEMLSSIVKQVVKKKNKEKSKKNKKNKLNVKKIKWSQINKLTLKFKLLMLNLNVLSEQLKQWDQSCKISRQMNMTNSNYASNFRSMYYECSKIKHNMRNYAEINTLINQEIIY